MTESAGTTPREYWPEDSRLADLRACAAGLGIPEDSSDFREALAELGLEEHEMEALRNA